MRLYARSIACAPVNRRAFLAKSASIIAVGSAGAALLGGTRKAVAQQASAGGSGYALPKLPYAFDALEPSIDARTMEIHYTKHHQGYVDKLNAALEGHPDLKKMAPEQLIAKLDAVPEDIRTAVRNNGGGHVNHTFFWKIMSPAKGQQPGGQLAEAIKQKFGSVAAFKEAFANAAGARFGSGWAWLVKSPDGLEVVSTANQDSPLSLGKSPIIGVDVWEHAYYLKYQNKRADYVSAWWDVVNWEQAEANFTAGA
ncbi:MAG: superoxide dismutase [Pirellulales bacterium]|nr:superoxide dismutase [Pirellulales bacterium]